MSDGGTTILVQGWLNVLQDADSQAGQQARAELIQHTSRRMEALCRKMFFQSLNATPTVDWEDVYQEAALKLWKALEDVKPSNIREFFGLATKKIREVSLDLCRKYVREPPPAAAGGEASFSPVTAAKWAEFHEQVRKLDDNLRETFELLWYHELTQKEVAAMHGVDESTVKRRFRKAREQLAEYVL
ncbi:MAG: sigma-70 family RNA polymerase sigma factor [Planctomycetales bacterium]|nr:sigma-70 family RNA polymerase sigma factor [Planctomycetales bacterium]